MLSFVKNGIEELINDNHSLAKRLGRFEPALSQLFPEARDIAGEVQELLRTHTETAKENKSLRKSIMTKDRKLAEHEAEGLRTRDFRSAVRRS
jgi:regulator of replication initiation timing